MKTTVDIPKELLRDVKIASRSRTNREAVTVALEEYLRVRRSAELAELLGTFDHFLSRDELETLRSAQ